MRQSLSWSLVLMLALIPLVSCDKGGGEGPSTSTSATVDEAEWPEQPATGQPVVLEFIEMVGEGDDLGATMRVFNFGEQAVTRLNTTLRYLNEAGEELDTFPFSVSQPEVVAATGQTGLTVGVMVPLETTRIEAVVLSVDFEGGESWAAE